MSKESTSEMVDRLRSMTNPRGKWDLSENDIAAIEYALSIVDTNACSVCWHGLDCHVSARGADDICDECFDPETLMGNCEHWFVAVRDREDDR